MKSAPVPAPSGRLAGALGLVLLLRGLADQERRGFVTVTQLAGWLGPRVARDSGGRQSPQYSALEGEGDFVFVLPEAPAAR